MYILRARDLAHHSLQLNIMFVNLPAIVSESFSVGVSSSTGGERWWLESDSAILSPFSATGEVCGKSDKQVELVSLVSWGLDKMSWNSCCCCPSSSLRVSVMTTHRQRAPRSRKN